MSDFDASKYRNDFIKQTYDRVNLTMPKGKKEQVKVAAATAGMSVNEFINAAIDAYMSEQQNGGVT